jgi:hypothetical protein
MFVVKTVLGPSDIHGFGVFAGETISKGEIVWRFHPHLDKTLEPSDVDRLKCVEREFIARYAYLHSGTGKYVLSVDDARFVNHSDNPNLVGVYPQGDPEGIDAAARDIRKGEELTSDYRTFDEEFRLKLGDFAR